VKKFIVSTTINPVTSAVKLYDSFDGWTLVMAGDLKTPKDYRLVNGIYLSPADQDELDHTLSELIGWNCIQRRNLAMLYAIKNGADIIALVDDDNIPLDNWGTRVYIGEEVEVTEFLCQDQAFDPIGAAGELNLWHRGFPLELIATREYSQKQKTTLKATIQANFWNGDPDIDAICRMEHRPNVTFDGRNFPFTSNKPAPFNSQNTLISRAVFSDYFLFPFVGRMDDIWAAYYVQAKDHAVIFGEPTVFQDRNKHDLVEDMKREYIGYENNLNLLKDLSSDADLILKYLPGRSIAAWNRYRRIIGD
jgi:hypothetical protein